MPFLNAVLSIRQTLAGDREQKSYPVQAMAAPAGRQGTIVVTGANGNLGTAIVRHLVSTPDLAAYRGLFTVRDASSPKLLWSALELARSPEGAVPDNILSLDLSKLSHVRQVAAAINEQVEKGKIPPLRAIVLNAGFCEFTSQTCTDDGFDMSFAANYLGHWLLTVLLLRSMDRECGRVVVIGSDTADPHNKLNGYVGQYKEPKWQSILSGDSVDPIAFGSWSTNTEDPSMMSGLRRYGAAKMCSVMMM